MAHRSGAKPLSPLGDRRSTFIKLNLTPEQKQRALQLAGEQSASAWLFAQVEHLLTPAPAPATDTDQPALFTPGSE